MPNENVKSPGKLQSKIGDACRMLAKAAQEIAKQHAAFTALQLQQGLELDVRNKPAGMTKHTETSDNKARGDFKNTKSQSKTKLPMTRKTRTKATQTDAVKFADQCDSVTTQTRTLQRSLTRAARVENQKRETNSNSTSIPPASNFRLDGRSMRRSRSRCRFGFLHKSPAKAALTAPELHKTKSEKWKRRVSMVPTFGTAVPNTKNKLSLYPQSKNTAALPHSLSLDEQTQHALTTTMANLKKYIKNRSPPEQHATLSKDQQKQLSISKTVVDKFKLYVKNGPPPKYHAPQQLKELTTADDFQNTKAGRARSKSKHSAMPSTAIQRATSPTIEDSAKDTKLRSTPSKSKYGAIPTTVLPHDLDQQEELAISQTAADSAKDLQTKQTCQPTPIVVETWKSAVATQTSSPTASERRDVVVTRRFRRSVEKLGRISSSLAVHKPKPTPIEAALDAAAKLVRLRKVECTAKKYFATSKTKKVLAAQNATVVPMLETLDTEENNDVILTNITSPFTFADKEKRQKRSHSESKSEKKLECEKRTRSASRSKITEPDVMNTAYNCIGCIEKLIQIAKVKLSMKSVTIEDINDTMDKIVKLSRQISLRSDNSNMNTEHLQKEWQPLLKCDPNVCVQIDDVRAAVANTAERVATAKATNELQDLTKKIQKNITDKWKFKISAAKTDQQNVKQDVASDMLIAANKIKIEIKKDDDVKIFTEDLS